MNVVHLGDLHLGVKFHKRSLIDDQTYALQQVVGIVEQKKAHTIIAGDVFDTINPSIEAQELWYSFMDQLGNLNSANGTSTLVVAGNHDSAARLAMGCSFLVEKNIFIVDKQKAFEVYELGHVPFVCVPFTKPALVESKLGVCVETYDEAFKEVLKQVSVDPSNAVLVCHQTFEGGKTGESEFKPFMPDAVSVNTVSRYPLTLVGHLHAHQNIKNVWYSGSLLPYAFGDDYDAGVSVWEGDCSYWKHTRVKLDVLHPLKTVSGGLEHCLAQPADDCYIKVKLTQCQHFEDALAKLQDHFPLLLSVVTDVNDTWEADLDKPVGTFSNVQEAITAFCEQIEIPVFGGKRKELIQEALDAYSQS